jgi:hypothetical protein
MILTNSIDPTVSQIGNEIWDTPLTDAIRAEAEETAYHVPTSIIRLIGHERLIARIAHDMSIHLRCIGDTYTAPDGVIYTLKTGSLDTEDRYASPMPAQQGRQRTCGRLAFSPATAVATAQIFERPKRKPGSHARCDD